ncbi:MAG TPA: disulfide bond formation protein B [Caulobacteraceae bacterium]|jgi:disulfide bond formation protein DsbB|nr:disulfide bond formation protein B [Caulobacteraceae bacterium]
MRALIATILRHWPALAFVTSAAMLAIAHAFETFGHLAPCTLCLYERQVYWVALPVAAIAFIAAQGVTPRVLTPWIGWALTLVFAVGAGIAIYHAGAEWKFWPGPTTCTGGGAVSASGLAGLMHGAKVAAPRCDKAAWVFLGLSMAGWNALISLKLAGWSAAWAVRSGKK